MAALGGLMLLGLCGCHRGQQGINSTLTIHQVAPAMSRQDVIAVQGAPLREQDAEMVYAGTVPTVYLDQSGMVCGVGPSDQLEEKGTIIARAGEPLRKLRSNLGVPTRVHAQGDARDRLFYDAERLIVDVVHPLDAEGRPVMTEAQLVDFSLGNCPSH